MSRYFVFILMGLLLVPNLGFAAIQFESMSEPWALSEESREKLVSKLKEIDLDELKDDLREAGEQLPDEVKDLPDKAVDKLEDEGIDATGIFSTIWKTFSSLAKWMVGLLTSLLD